MNDPATPPPVYPSEHPALTELQRSYAHAAALSRANADMRAELVERDKTIASLRQQLAASTAQPLQTASTSKRIDLEEFLAGEMGKLAGVRLGVDTDVATRTNPGQIAFLQAESAGLTERIRSLQAARQVYRADAEDLDGLAEWVTAEWARWDPRSDPPAAAESGDPCGVARAAGWAHQVQSHRDALTELYRFLTGHPCESTA